MDVPDRLRSYAATSVLSAVQELGFESDVLSADIWRNGSGTMLLVSRRAHIEPTYVFSSKKQGNVILPPEGAIRYWLDDHANVFAWANADGLVRFIDGRHFGLHDRAGAMIGFDDSGQFMYIHDSAKSRTSVFDVHSLIGPVGEFDAVAVPLRLYVQNSHLLFYGTKIDNDATRSDGGDALRVMHIFERRGNELIDRGVVPIPSRCHLVDLDVAGPTALLRQYNDLPFSDKYFLFYWRDRRMVSLGSIRPGICRFLVEDVLQADQLSTTKRRWN